MSENLNQNLYSRFGLNLDIERVRDGFQKHMKNVLLDTLAPIVRPSSYEQREELRKVQQLVLKESCRQLFLDFDDYDNWEHGCQWFFENEFYDEFDESFEEYLVRLQVIMNVLFKHKLVKYELGELATSISDYLEDYPVLGITIKVYKQKSPQILPSTSRKFEHEIKNTLGLLESNKKYEYALSNFENGLKEFLTAKTQAQYKDVIEDMYTSCDDLVKAVSGDRNKGFKHISDKTMAATLKLNGHQKELYKNLRVWMDEIKHGTIKDFDRFDTEMIISLLGSLIRFIISKNDKS